MMKKIFILSFCLLALSCQKESIQHSAYVNIYIPNSFTPDRNGINEEFKPAISYNGGSIISWEFTIWNDQQQKVFFTSNINEGWNGKEMNTGKVCKMGSYSYIIKYKDNTFKAFYVEGNVMLMK